MKEGTRYYNKRIMNSGLKSNEYINENLGLIQNYVTNYDDRLDFWTNKLNTRQLDLLQDKYLAENAAMLRGKAAFGSNSETNRQIEQNAYEQQNYLANVQNANVQAANALQTNELQALSSATQLNMQNREAGAAAAERYDQAKQENLNALVKIAATGLMVAGGVVAGGAIGAGGLGAAAGTAGTAAAGTAGAAAGGSNLGLGLGLLSGGSGLMAIGSSGQTSQQYGQQAVNTALQFGISNAASQGASSTGQAAGLFSAANTTASNQGLSTDLFSLISKYGNG